MVVRWRLRHRDVCRRALRPHADIDVLILRRDQQVMLEALPGWDLQAADPPSRLRPWPSDEVLPDHVHDIWCREGPGSPWRMQVMLDEADGGQWHSRRNSAVSMPVAEMGRTNPDGWPYLAPEVQLFYKAKADQQLPKDEIDFAAALPLLEPRARGWLDAALGETVPQHHWRASLT